ncbi:MULTISPECIES: glycosyltransferase family 2 protein [unclassified Streptomyces]|uniref:glycosyltransferase family 2 protein n=1 Tax=unclassified Streptomyces TaxID=2593676 RepID=UPI0003634540|nr:MULTISPECIES: glycosyltransferase family 2 protein [unclassified Streptomyces]MYY05923.1 glycosyltransferase [Streptomyces sp. SID4913]
MHDEFSALALFRDGPLTAAEFTAAMDRHGANAPAAESALLALRTGKLLEAVATDPAAGDAPVHGLSERGKAELTRAVTEAAAELSASGPVSLLVGRPESNRRGHDGEPLPMAVGHQGKAEVRPELWPPYDLPQHTPTESLGTRRDVSWWPWTVPEPCGCLWARPGGGDWAFVPRGGLAPCARPASAFEGLATPATRTDGPLVTAVMPTADRPHFVQRAIKYFMEQTYRSKELLVVDDGLTPVDHLVPQNDSIRYLRLDGKNTIGSKMNAGANAAHGEILSQWDDDDWHGPNRMATQVAPILAGNASITAFEGAPFYHLPTQRTWSAPNSLMRLHHKNGIHCGTLVYTKKAWQSTEGYPDLSFFEQTTFLDRVLAAGGHLETVLNNAHYVQIRHTTNTWHDDVLGIPGWTPQEDMPWLPDEALDFYRSLRK